MGNAFSGLSKLERLIATSPAKHNTACGPSTARTRTRSYPDQDLGDLPRFLADHIDMVDPSLPDVRDLRKFVRRLPRLRSMLWTGRGGKGEWHFSKRSTLVGVEFVHSAVLTRDTWDECQRPAPTFEFEDVDEAATTVLETATPPFSPDSNEFPCLPRAISSNSALHRQTMQTHPRAPCLHDKQQPVPILNVTTMKQATSLGVGLDPLSDNGVSVGVLRTSDAIAERINQHKSPATHRRASTSDVASRTVSSRRVETSGPSSSADVAHSSHVLRGRSTPPTGSCASQKQKRQDSVAKSLGRGKTDIQGIVDMSVGSSPRAIPGAGHLQKNLNEPRFNGEDASVSAVPPKRDPNGWATIGDPKRGSSSTQSKTIASSGNGQHGRK